MKNKVLRRPYIPVEVGGLNIVPNFAVVTHFLFFAAISAAQLHLTNPELWLSTVSNPACSVSEINDDENF